MGASVASDESLNLSRATIEYSENLGYMGLNLFSFKGLNDDLEHSSLLNGLG